MNWLDLCRPRPCIACGRDDGTIVPAHRNEGKGMGLKAPDWTVIPLCRACHAIYDAGPDPLADKREFWRQNWIRHMSGLMEAGLVSPVGHMARERGHKPIAKIIDRNTPPRPWPPSAA